MKLKCLLFTGKLTAYNITNKTISNSIVNNRKLKQLWYEH